MAGNLHVQQVCESMSRMRSLQTIGPCRVGERTLETALSREHREILRQALDASRGCSASLRHDWRLPYVAADA